MGWARVGWGGVGWGEASRPTRTGEGVGASAPHSPIELYQLGGIINGSWRKILGLLHEISHDGSIAATRNAFVWDSDIDLAPN